MATRRLIVRWRSALQRRGHRVRFFERDVPWYAEHRDLAAPAYCDVHLYSEHRRSSSSTFRTCVHADLVILGSYVPEGRARGRVAAAPGQRRHGFL